MPGAGRACRRRKPLHRQLAKADGKTLVLPAMEKAQFLECPGQSVKHPRIKSIDFIQAADRRFKMHGIKQMADLLDNSIIQAPMAGASNAALVCAANHAGALGSLGAGNMDANSMRIEVEKIRRLSSRPFNINLFVSEVRKDYEIPVAEIDRLRNHCLENGLDFVLPRQFAPDFHEQFQALIDLAPPIASFTFGILEKEAVAALHQRNIFVIGTATSLPEAIAWQNVGADAICVQGIEAGGHQGSFIEPTANLPLRALLAQIRPMAKLPLIAAGGLMTGLDIASCMQLGANAAQLGTAFLCCTESPISQTYRDALLGKLGKPKTVLSTAFSGRKARGIANSFIHAFDGTLVSPYPFRNALTQSLRQSANKKCDHQNMSLWAGCGLAHCREMDAKTLVETLKNEIRTAKGHA
jgi:nitronate monooxygenase